MTCILNMKNFCLNVYVYVYTYPWEGVMKTNKGTQERCTICRYQGSGKEECIGYSRHKTERSQCEGRKGSKRLHQRVNLQLCYYAHSFEQQC